MSAPTVGRLPAHTMVLGLPLPAIALAGLLGGVGILASAYVLIVPFDAAAFGGLTIPTVVAAGFADGFNPCAFALLVLFATYTLTLLNAVTANGTPTLEARRRLLGAGSLYVAAVFVTYFIIGVGLLSSSAGWAVTTSSRASPRSSPCSWPCSCSRTCSCRVSGHR